MYKVAVYVGQSLLHRQLKVEMSGKTCMKEVMLRQPAVTFSPSINPYSL